MFTFILVHVKQFPSIFLNAVQAAIYFDFDFDILTVHLKTTTVSYMGCYASMHMDQSPIL